MAVKLIPGSRRRQVQEHGDFIAFIGVLETVYTLAPYMIRQIVIEHFLEAQAFKKLRAGSEGENSSQSDGSRFGNTFFDQLGADAGSLKIRQDRHGANFSHILPEYVQGGNADDRAVVLPVDKILPHLAVKVAHRAG